jgi:hypothetical protein
MLQDLRNICERLASSLGSDELYTQVRLLEAFASSQIGGNYPEGDWKDPKEIQRIGIWSREGAGGPACFKRCSQDDSHGMWAPTEQIPPKSNKKRIVLLGESVGHGFISAPHFTPARALQHTIDRYNADTEVCDLTRLGLNYWQLLELMVSCRCLEPDAVVIMAGNNWQPQGNPDYGWSPASFREMAAILRDSGHIADVKGYLERQLDGMVRQFLKTAGALTQQYGIPVVYVLPEFNLADWRDPEVISPLLPSDALRSWHVALAEARQALLAGDHATAIKYARQMIEIDRSTHPSGHYVLYHALRRTADPETLRSILEQARDANFALLNPELSRCYRRIAEIVRCEAPHHDVQLVDVPHQMHLYLGGTLPGRRMFFDNCHMTPEAIQLCMSHVAERLLDIFGPKHSTWRAMLHDRMPLSGKGIAQAHFLAALYNSLFDQDYDVIRFHLETALEAFPHMADAFVSLLNLKTCRTPLTFCSPMIAAIVKWYGPENPDDSAVPQIPALARLLEWEAVGETRCLELALIRALTEALRPQLKDISLRMSDRLIEQHAVSPAGSSMLERAYNQTQSFAQTEWKERKIGAYEAYSLKSVFLLVWDGASTISVSMSYRVPNTDTATDQVEISVNNSKITSLPCKSHWNVARFSIPSSVLTRGVNHFSVGWPMPQEQAQSHFKQVSDALELGSFQQTRLVYGELHELWMKAVDAVPENVA